MATQEPAQERDELRNLLGRYNEHPAEREGIVDEIDRRFLRRLAVLVLDTCGFSRAVHARGIVHFMALLERLERVVRPGIEGMGGTVLRREADNVFAVFGDVAAAADAAQVIRRDLRTANEALPVEEEVEVSIGIGYGDLLVIGDHDVWGEEMNLASKLGEDLAECGDVLLTPAAGQELGDRLGSLEERTTTISGMELVTYRLPDSEGAA